MIILECAQTAAAQPARLIFPDGIGGKRRRGARQCGDFGIGGAEIRNVANEAVRCVLGVRAVRAHLVEWWRNRHRLRGHWARAGQEQRQQP